MLLDSQNQDNRWREAEQQELSRIMELFETDTLPNAPGPRSVMTLYEADSSNTVPTSFRYSLRPDGSPRAALVTSSSSGRTVYTVSRAARRIHHTSNNPRKVTCSRALVDRGANGGIAGPEMRLVCWTKRYVDLSGIDDHTLEAVRVGSFSTVIKTHLGDRIDIWHQMASMPTGKSILSSVQMEASRCSINEKSPHIT